MTSGHNSEDDSTFDTVHDTHLTVDNTDKDDLPSLNLLLLTSVIIMIIRTIQILIIIKHSQILNPATMNK